MEKREKTEHKHNFWSIAHYGDEGFIMRQTLICKTCFAVWSIGRYDFEPKPVQDHRTGLPSFARYVVMAATVDFGWDIELLTMSEEEARENAEKTLQAIKWGNVTYRKVSIVDVAL